MHESIRAFDLCEMELRRGPWTPEEDNRLIGYIALHGEGRWNLLAQSSGLKCTGKSCRLRWLNYLRPGVKRGNFSFEEQLLIFELHSKWGNRWSKISKHLPGRSDNEIKNYCRSRFKKHVKQLMNDSIATTTSPGVFTHSWGSPFFDANGSLEPGTYGSSCMSSSSSRSTAFPDELINMQIDPFIEGYFAENDDYNVGGFELVATVPTSSVLRESFDGCDFVGYGNLCHQF